ncbi:c-type cytochrome [Tatumella saanichensis]|uniref:c-type cytochrome n=1 Tax=Tatumella saanichensis TaxID=480813 RepID=UPI0004A39830|nr:cytochrome c [Tatumella saanichensis]
MKMRLLALVLSSVAFSAFADDTSGQDLVKQGEYLARAGDCVACHTSPGGKPFAGGLAMTTPIGTIYSSNITPDKQDGIGNYSYDDFQKAVRQGIAKNGETLYPAMPYPSYASVSDADMHALYAYFMQGVQPVAQKDRATDIPWPLSMRWPLAIWRHLFAPEVKPVVAAAGEDPVVARGQYLVEGLGHCGACHTPRAMTMQENVLNNSDGTAYLSGGSSPIDGWNAVDLRGDNQDGLGRWSTQDLEQFLRYGRNDHTAAFGGMTQVVQDSLQYMSDSDIHAIAAYLKTLSPNQPNQTPFKGDDSVAQALWKGDDHMTGAGAYVDSCAACHKTDGNGYTRFFPALKGNPVVLDKDPTSLIHIILTGDTLPGVQGAPSAITMPAFGWRLNDQKVADIANFVRSSWGNNAAGTVTASQVADIRKSAEVKGKTGSDTIKGLKQQPQQ